METHRLALTPGYQIEHFRIESILGKGGFGITYLAVDLQLGKRVAIKELLPDSIATRIDGSTVVPQSESQRESWEWARERFLDEARVLAGFSHPSIVGVHRLIEANGTVYMVMDYVDGESYEARLRRIGREPNQAALMAVVGPLLDGLSEVHAKGLLHRDIKPENILINQRGQPVLIDFGSARMAVGATMTMTSIVTHGYSPIEQYQTKGRMGPWTDIYAVGAVMCRAITGEKPPVAADRLMEDEFIWLSHRGLTGFDETFLAAVDWALRVRPEERPQYIDDWDPHLGTQAPGSGPTLGPKPPEPPSGYAEAPPESPPEVETIELPVAPPAKKMNQKKGLGFAGVGLVLLVGLILGIVVSNVASPEKNHPHGEEAAVTPAVPDPGPTAPTATAAPAATPTELLRAQQLFAEADRHFRVGEFEKALATLDEVNAVIPGDPSVSLRKAEILEKLDRPAEAVVALEEALNVPALPPNIRAQAEKKMAILTQRIRTGGRTNSAAGPDQNAVVGENRDSMRDPIGLKPGADLGIVDTLLQDGTTGMKRLRVAVRSRPGVEIKVPEVRIYIYFYEEGENGEIVITDSRVKTEWLSPPVNWAADEPELLLGQYIPPESDMPGSSTANGAPGRKSHGYIVAVYYHQELQDFRSEPATLAKEFPVPLYLKE